VGVATVLISVCVGLVAGALLPLPAYRLSVAADEPNRTTCIQCGQPLAGWVQPVGRCRGCGQRLGPPAWATALAAGVACGLLALSLWANPALPLYLGLAVLGVLLAAVDLATKRLPYKLVSPAILVSVVLFALVALAIGAWATWLRALAGAAVLGLVFLILSLLPGAGLGFGDVRLSVLLGLFLGWLGWPAVVWGALLPWLIHGPVALALLVSGRVGRKSTLPFGPAMFTGALLAVLCVVWLPTLLRP
jgi:leader peptidase (prepilin peptidase) / N-methyltransferase